MNQADFDLLKAWIPTRDLQGDGDALWINFSIIGNWMLANGHPFSASALDNALQRYIVNSQNGYKLRWKTRLQDSEAAEKQRREVVKTPAHQEKSELVNYNDGTTLAPHLRAWREMLHRKPDDQPAGTQPATNEWKDKAEAVLNDTNSNVDRAKAEKLKGYVNGEINWEATFRLRARYLEQRKVERQNAGR
jgi:hypothetical protein